MEKIFNSNGTITIVMTEREYFNHFFGEGHEVALEPIVQAKPELPVLSLEQQVTDILVTLGVPRNIKGFNFSRKAISLAVNSGRYLEYVTGLLYPELAKEFGTTPSRVERAIRHSIEISFSRFGGSVIWQEFFPVIGIKKPTNSEFIATIADYLRLGSGGKINA